MGKKNFIFLIFGVFFAISLFFFQYFLNLQKTEAGTNHNVYGWAWSENIGWISFNNTSGGGGINYGVNIENPVGDTANITGYAWSENIGWIRFDPPGPYPGAPNYSARLNINTKEISGWARACAGAQNPDCTGGTNPLAGGWDGWIKLRGTATNGSTYGVYIDDSVVPHEFKGFAWGSDVLGWISFNTANVPGGSDYKVLTSFTFNRPPTATNLSADPHNPQDYCGITSGGSPLMRVRWRFSDPDPGDLLSKFHIRVYDAQTGALVIDTGEINQSGSSNPQDFSLVVAPTYGSLSWGRNYRWEIKVWDNRGAFSSWVQSPTQFSTPSHPYPLVRTTFDPPQPVLGQNVQFCSVFEAGKCENPPPGGWSICYTSNCTFSWTIQDFEYGTSSSPTSQNPAGHFTSDGQKNYNLRITDQDGLSCLACSPQDCTLQVRRIPIWFP